MDAFVLKPIEQYKPQREAELERLRILNPDAPLEELAVLVAKQVDFVASAWWQFHVAFDERHMNEYVTVAFLAHALAEAVINAVLAIGLAGEERAELFPLLEKADFKDKWLVGPKAFAPQYTFPKGSGLHETLVMLSRHRNALTHHKIELSVGEEKVLKGSAFTRATYEEERRWMRRYFSLPYDLAALAQRQLQGGPMMLLWERSPIGFAPEHGT